jgi:hypothetical protein
MKNKIIALFALTALLILTSCEKDDQSSKAIINKSTYELMKEWYFWYDQLPEVDPNSYPDPKALVEAIRVNPPDRWSYVTTKQEHDAYYKQAEYIGFGFGTAFTEDFKLYITFVFKSSQLYAAGIRRGWEIIGIDGQTPTPDNYADLLGPAEEGVTKTFTFKSPEGNIVEHTFVKGPIDINTVLMDTVYNFNEKKVGYFVLKSFVEKTASELEIVFQKFKNENVDELICDLRYNTGGLVSVSKLLGSLLYQVSDTNTVFGSYVHNDKKTENNSSIYFKPNANALVLDRVLFITTENTASASELVINALKPYISVFLIGSRTHGKPVGMYSFAFNDPTIDWLIVPVCFTIRNAKNEGDYYDGIPVDVEADDDIFTPFGEITENSLNSALTYLGISTSKVSKHTVKSKAITGKGLYEEIGAW